MSLAMLIYGYVSVFCITILIMVGYVSLGWELYLPSTVLGQSLLVLQYFYIRGAERYLS